MGDKDDSWKTIRPKFLVDTDPVSAIKKKILEHMKRMHMNNDPDEFTVGVYVHSAPAWGEAVRQVLGEVKWAHSCVFLREDRYGAEILFGVPPPHTNWTPIDPKRPCDHIKEVAQSGYNRTPDYRD